MTGIYHRSSGTSLDRLAAISDGIFAVVMTLLVLDLRVPVLDAVRVHRPLWSPGAAASEQVLWHALAGVAPRLLTYFMSFLTLAIFWLAQQTQLNQYARTDRTLTMLNLGFLLVASLMPFSTALLAEFITFRLALLVYWANLLLLGLTLLASLRYAERAALLRAEAPAALVAAARRRVLRYQAGYAIAAAGCVVDTYLSIALIVLLQLYSVVAPWLRLPGRPRRPAADPAAD